MTPSLNATSELSRIYKALRAEPSIQAVHKKMTIKVSCSWIYKFKANPRSFDPGIKRLANLDRAITRCKEARNNRREV